MNAQFILECETMEASGFFKPADQIRSTMIYICETANEGLDFKHLKLR